MSCRGRSRASAGVVVSKAVVIIFDLLVPGFNIPITTDRTIVPAAIHQPSIGIVNALLVVTFTVSPSDNSLPAIFEVIIFVAVVVSVSPLHHLRLATITTTAES